MEGYQAFLIDLRLIGRRLVRQIIVEQTVSHIKNRRSSHPRFIPHPHKHCDIPDKWQQAERRRCSKLWQKKTTTGTTFVIWQHPTWEGLCSKGLSHDTWQNYVFQPRKVWEMQLLSSLLYEICVVGETLPCLKLAFALLAILFIPPFVKAVRSFSTNLDFHLTGAASRCY